MTDTYKFRHIAIAALSILIPFSYGGNGEFALMLLCSVILLLWGREFFVSCRTRKFFFKCCGAEKLLATVFVLIFFSTIFSSYLYASIYSCVIFSCLVGTFYLVFQESFLSFNAPLLLAGITLSAIIQSVLVIYQNIFMNIHRPSGTFVNPNFCSLLIVIGLLVVLSYMIFFPIRHKKLYWFVILFMVIAIFITRSRASFVAIIFGLSLIAVLLRKKVIITTVLVLVLCVFLFPNPIRGRFFEGISGYVRIPIWKASLRIIKENPLIGVGLGNFRYYSKPYTIPSKCTESRYYKLVESAHSEPLQQGGEMGLPGLFLYFAFWWFLYKNAIERKSELFSGSKDAWVLLASESGLFSIFVASLVNNSLHTVGISFPTAILAAIVIWGNKEHKQLEFQFIPDSTYREISFIKVFSVLILSFAWFLSALSPYMGAYYSKSAAKAQNSIEAKKLLKAAIAWNPIHAYYYNSLGEIYGKLFLKEGKKEYFIQAKSYFESAVSKNYREKSFEHNIGVLFYHRYLKTKDRENLFEALVHLYKEQKLTPKSPFVRKSIASIYIEIGALDKAVFELKKAVEVEPNYINAWYLLYKIQKKQHKYKESYKSLKKVISLAGYITLEVNDKVLKEHAYIKKLLHIPTAFIEDMGC